MSKKQILTLVLAFTALTAQIVFAAALPANAKNVAASIVNGALTVTWTRVDGAAFYRVYYSHQSIIGNAGNYDDFERTTGAETVHTFAKLPLTSPKIFVGVLAVDAAGNESEGFETEASVDRPAAPVSSSAATIPEALTNSGLASSSSVSVMPRGENPTTTAEPMNIVSVVPVSSTGVLVTFTKPVKTDAQITPLFFLATDSGGIALGINAVKIDAATILLTTNPQIPERSYTFGLLQPVPAGDGTNAMPAAMQVQFKGFGAPVAAPQPEKPAEPQQPTAYGQNPMFGGNGNPALGNVGDPSFLDLKATPRKDGTYDVVARWIGAPGVQNYGLYTAVNGQPYTWNSQVGPDQTTVQYSHVRPGNFALRVTSRTGQGQESRGVERALDLPASGIGVIGIMAAAGAAAGLRLRRRKFAV